MNSQDPAPSFLFLFRDPADLAEPQPAQVAALMAWIENVKAQGQLLAGGSLAPAPACVLRGPRGSTITDGPFPESKEVFAGFMQVAAQDFERALALAQGCPILRAGTSLEVRQVAPTDGRPHPL